VAGQGQGQGSRLHLHTSRPVVPIFFFARNSLEETPRLSGGASKGGFRVVSVRELRPVVQRVQNVATWQLARHRPHAPVRCLDYKNRAGSVTTTSRSDSRHRHTNTTSQQPALPTGLVVAAAFSTPKR
jgi:hypothetical protein